MTVDELLGLPEEVLEYGSFCVTRKGDKQPYDPVLKKSISAKDEFYGSGVIVDYLEDYETIGLKIGNGISAIDIDDCFVNGVMNDIANIFIDEMRSYTELSPSGTGVRILFESANLFDRHKYYIKNSKLNVEYYDGNDQELNGARMVRLSGRNITNYEYRKVDTTDLLDRYMTRDIRINPNYISSTKYSKRFVRIASYLMKYDLDMFELNNREFIGKSESDWDMTLLNKIGKYSANKQEIQEIFERSKYFKTKSVRHTEKWKGSRYRERTMNIMQPDPSVYLYSRKVVAQVVEPNLLMIYHLAIEYNVLNPFHFKEYDIPKVKMKEQDRADQLLAMTKIKGLRKKLKAFFENNI